MEALEIKTIFTITLFNINIPITETVIVSWGVMVILIVGSLLLTRKLKEVPAGAQTILETAVEFLNNFAQNQFGRFAKYLGPYMGTLLLFILLSNIAAVVSPVGFTFLGHAFTPPFPIRPPTKDINVTAAFAVITLLLIIVCGFAARGFVGWFKRLFYPIPFMLPFNLMDYATRPLTLALRLFGNMLGGLVMMTLIEGLLPVALPAVMSLYFDFFDGIIQAVIFVFLSSLYIAEAVKVNEE
jgi:F-type H+-transporting ATPase subunit a